MENKNCKIKASDVSFVTGYALQSYACAEKGIIDASLNGYQYWYIDGSLSSDIAKAWNNQRIANMISMIEQHKIYPIFHGNYKVPLSSDVDELRNAAIEYTKKEIDLASELSAPIIIHGGAIVEPRLINSVRKQALNNFLSSLNELQSYATKKNVPIYLENLSNYKHYRPFLYIFTNEEEFDFILSSTDLLFFLDLGHANIGNISPQAIFEKNYKRIVGMSFSNNNGQQDQHLSLMRGTIDYIRIVSSIQTVGWKGIVAFETRDNSPSASILELRNIYKNAGNF
ncbi:MAG: sugar phosphate isomerase/epimerase family protein [Gammaproteobacteria bacterium]